MNAKYRGRGWAIDSSRIRAASSSTSWTRESLRQPGADQLPHPFVQRRLLGPEPVEAPRLRHEPDGVLERFLARRVEVEWPLVLIRSLYGRPGIPSGAQIVEDLARRRPALHHQGDDNPRTPTPRHSTPG